MTGDMPFYGADDDEIFRKINRATYKSIARKIRAAFPRSGRSAIVRLLEKMLEPNPTTRADATECVEHAWFAKPQPAGRIKTFDPRDGLYLVREPAF